MPPSTGGAALTDTGRNASGLCQVGGAAANKNCDDGCHALGWCCREGTAPPGVVANIEAEPADESAVRAVPSRDGAVAPENVLLKLAVPEAEEPSLRRPGADDASDVTRSPASDSPTSDVTKVQPRDTCRETPARGDLRECC